MAVVITRSESTTFKSADIIQDKDDLKHVEQSIDESDV